MNIIETAWNWSSGLSNRAKTDYIALHHAAAVKCNAADVDRWHKQNGWSGIGYHYFVRKNGDIYRGRPEWSIGAHVQGMNSQSIGICAEGNYDIETNMPDAQYNAILDLISDIKTRYPNAKVVGHREIGSSDCPGKYYPLDDIKNNVNIRSDELTMTQYDEIISIIAQKENELASLRTELDAVKALTTDKMIYNYIDDNMPLWAREGVQWCLDNGIIQGTGDGLGLDDKDLKYCTIIKRVAERS